MQTIYRDSTNHDFEKTNLVTKYSRKGNYDDYKCTNCGMKGKSYRLNEIQVSDTYSSSNVANCKKAPLFQPPKKIKITQCTASGEAFKNLTNGSVHDVVTPPEGYKNDYRGVWVMGVGEPVKVLNNEFEKIE
ncbi:hypothetical protein GCM10007424_23470 [Flavobacterium suaedae]|uniref:Uncharacterized protein n=1 Tax=Flavobacterium suaedae TaxID=1767027 RepID=A0ABQ1K3F5_9FLAO|nr:hypothetical protein [Flavobacterium suaedae]GGB82740.1 hypothetical protein GCM10007424_23470 [Flavobacterium suaedae]